MKIIHTSDWHLGQAFYNYDRSDEHKDMLRQIVEIVGKEQPDALLVSGDIYHTGNPSNAAVEIYNKALLQMHLACPSMQIVVIAGNHDSAARLVVNNALWQHFKVSILGQVARNDDAAHTPLYDANIISIRDGQGDVLGYVAAVPHCYESNFPADDASLQREERLRAYFQGLLDYVGTLNASGKPVVVMAHLAVSGCNMAGHDAIGGMETKELAALGAGYDYLALGHIHSPQDLDARVRYCGSPIPVNFGEMYQHSVSVVEVEHGQEPIVRKHDIANIIPLVDFPTPLPDADAQEDKLDADKRPLSYQDVLQRIEEFEDRLCYMRVVVKQDATFSALAETRIAEIVKGKKVRVCKVQPFAYKTKTSNDVAAPERHLTKDELKNKSPLEIAEMFFRQRGIELTDKQRKMIQSCTNQAQTQP